MGAYVSILDGVVGGMISAGITTVISHAIEEHGGVEGLMSQFQQSGLGSIAESWVGNGPNQPITAEQVEKVMGSDTIRNIAAKFGIPADQIAAKLAEHLPAAVDKLTPEGTVTAAA